MKFGSLFAGIGGFDLGLERAGHACAWQCEIDPHARAILNKHWPEVPCYGDIRSINWADVEPVDLVCGGYPCQPFSHAGARKGESDPRHLWPEVAHCLRHLRPRFVLLENVPGHLSLGFGDVLGDLAALGYDAWWDCLPAAALGAPHLRDRVFVVAWRSAAHAHRAGCEKRHAPAEPGQAGLSAGTPDPQWVLGQDDPHAAGARRRRFNDAASLPESERAAGVDLSTHWVSGSPVAPVLTVADGVPASVVRSGLKQAGNAIVPQIAELLGGVLAELERA